MRFDPKQPPRRYKVGWREQFDISDCGTIDLEPDEQVTFTTEAGGELDVTRKNWGFYATPSLNARLVEFGLHAVLVRNRIDRYFLLLVEHGKEAAFEAYLASEELDVVLRLHDDEELRRLSRALDGD